MTRVIITLSLLLAMTCRTEFVTINGQSYICTICGQFTWCNGA